MRTLFTILLLQFCLIGNMQASERDTSLIAQDTMSAVQNSITNPAIQNYKDTKYWKRHNTYKAFAWTSLSLGICGMGVGFWGYIASAINNDDTKPFVATFLGSFALTLGSIPLFKAASNNKKKAKRSVNVGLTASQFDVISPCGDVQKQPAIGLYFSF